MNLVCSLKYIVASYSYLYLNNDKEKIDFSIDPELTIL